MGWRLAITDSSAQESSFVELYGHFLPWRSREWDFTGVRRRARISNE